MRGFAGWSLAACQLCTIVPGICLPRDVVGASSVAVVIVSDAVSRLPRDAGGREYCQGERISKNRSTEIIAGETLA
jgi:hypothetical protein